MPLFPTAVLPKNILAILRGSTNQIGVSPALLDAVSADPVTVMERLGTSESGLTEEEASRRLERHGANVVTEEARHTKIRLLGKAFLNPLVILLLALATVSFLTGDLRAAVVMLIMVVLGVVLRFVQEARADDAAAQAQGHDQRHGHRRARAASHARLPLGQLGARRRGPAWRPAT